MVRHIVLWRFLDTEDGESKQANLLKARSLLLGLKTAIPEIRELEVGIVRGGCDLVLNSTFDSQEDLQKYQAHAEHQAVVRFLRTVHSGKIVADYEL
jgi:hypothetical protein